MNQLLITSICSSVAGLNNPACVNATKATLMHTNMDNEINAIQSRIESQLNVFNLNNPVFTYLGVAYKIGIDKRINYTVSNFMTCDKLNFGVGTTSIVLGVEWKI